MSSGYTLRSQPLLTSRSFGFSFLRDAPSEERKECIKFHVTADDYFGTIATVLGLIADSLQRDTPKAQKNLDDLKDELVYLQERYRIEPKVSPFQNPLK